MFSMRMKRGLTSIAVFFFICTMSVATVSAAQYPDRPVDFIVNWGAGGGADQFARVIARLLEKELKVSFPVSNMPGASGNTGLAKLLSLKADGYAISILTGVTFATFIDGSSPHKIENFDWIARTQYTPSMLFVSDKSPYKTIEDLLADARKRPNQITVGTDGLGSPADFTLHYLKKKGIDMKNIPFDKPAERYLAPVAGEVDVLYEEPGDVKSFLDAKKIRPLILFAEERALEFPNVPCSFEKNLPVSFPNWRGVVAKRGTPADRIEIMAKAFVNAMKTNNWKEYCAASYSCDLNPPILSKFEAWVKTQMAIK